MSAEPISFRLTGLRPLLMHCSRLVDPLDALVADLARITSKRDKTPADHEQIAKIEWTASLWLTDEKPCIPAEAIESAFIGAARSRRRGKAAQSGFLCSGNPILKFTGPVDLDALWEDPRFRFRYPVQINGARTMRTRPRFPEWLVDVTAEFVPSVLSRQEVLEFLEIAGFREGLGDWRPKFGRFSVQLLE
jgi:hypothetical protein